jgi:hypothetical protein
MRMISSLALSLSVHSIATASQFQPLVTCNNRELVIDLKTEAESEDSARLQVVINGRLPIDTLTFPSGGVDRALQNLDVSFYNERNKMVVTDLLGASRSGGFVHIYEGAGYHPFAAVKQISSIFDLEYIGNIHVSKLPTLSEVNPDLIVNFFLRDQRGGTGIGGSEPLRNNDELEVQIARNSYIFKNCSTVR